MSDDAERPPLPLALMAVKADVGAVGKDGAVTSGPARFNFRGVDAVVNAVAPALIRHGVNVAPVNVTVERSALTTGKGSAMRVVDVIVTYRWTGPAGDHLDTMAPGEAFDSGDKATAKAMSVAYRTCILQTLSLPTDEPDPDSTTYAVASHEPPPPPPPEPDPRTQAQDNVRSAWAVHRGEFTAESAIGHYRSWSNGGNLITATTDQLNEYANYLALGTDTDDAT